MNLLTLKTLMLQAPMVLTGVSSGISAVDQGINKSYALIKGVGVGIVVLMIALLGVTMVWKNEEGVRLLKDRFPTIVIGAILIFGAVAIGSWLAGLV